MFIRSLDEKETETEQLENLSGETLPHIFPQDEAGQSMRWSKFKNRDSREIFERYAHDIADLDMQGDIY